MVKKVYIALDMSSSRLSNKQTNSQWLHFRSNTIHKTTYMKTHSTSFNEGTPYSCTQYNFIDWKNKYRRQQTRTTNKGLTQVLVAKIGDRQSFVKNSINTIRVNLVLSLTNLPNEIGLNICISIIKTWSYVQGGKEHVYTCNYSCWHHLWQNWLCFRSSLTLIKLLLDFDMQFYCLANLLFISCNSSVVGKVWLFDSIMYMSRSCLSSSLARIVVMSWAIVFLQTLSVGGVWF